MRIEVWKAYTGNRAKKPIELGIYNEGDKRLYGLARYLIDNGNAVEIEAEEEEEPKPTRTRKAKAS